MQLVGQTPRDFRMREQATRNTLRGKLSSLPKPQQTEWELEAAPEDREETAADLELSSEDAAVRDKRNAEIAHAAALADFKRQTKVVQRGLPRPKVVDFKAMMSVAQEIQDPIERQIAEEAALLMANDAQKFKGAKLNGKARPVDLFDDELMQRAQMEVVLEMGQDADRSQFGRAFEVEWENAHAKTVLPGLAGYAEDELDEEQLLTEAFDSIQEDITKTSEKGNALEKKLAKHHGGYLERQKKLKLKVSLHHCIVTT